MTPLFGPGWGNYAIRGILETEIPDPVSLRPETPGWPLLAAFLIAWVAYKLLRRWRVYRRNQYRRDALTELALLRKRQDGGDEQALRELAPLLRATVMQADTSTTLRLLSGDAWAEAVQKLAPGHSALPVSTLLQLGYAPLIARSEVDYAPLFQAFEQWIRVHELKDA